MFITPPATRQELVERAETLTGKTVQQVAKETNMAVPASMKHAKGWVGNLLETLLGADAASSPEPDFTKLGIELKTIPINKHGKPKESTYICVVQLEPGALKDWNRSLVKSKLTEVLWIPVEAGNDIPVKLRRIGVPVLWKPGAEEENTLRRDWQEFSDMIAMGEIDKIDAAMGKYLQVRPKAANSKILTRDKNNPEDNLTLPRGYYLRAAFTQGIVSKRHKNFYNNDA